MNVTSIVTAGPITPIVTRTTRPPRKPEAVVERRPATTPLGPPMADRPLHRLFEVRQQEGLTRAQVARRMGISLREVERQEQSSSDISLNDLCRWQRALGVPIGELLSEPEGELSPPVCLRAKLTRAMKTARSIQQWARQPSMRRLAETLVDQLVEVMPELVECGPWPAVGHHRIKRAFGQAFYRGLLLGPVDELEDREGQ
jgi:transcriptional regulator with XRE-family HTH domain